VGRGTLFRNFPSEEDLIAAIVVEQMTAVAEEGRALLERSDAGEALFEFLEDMARRQREGRALFEAIADTFLANEEIRAAYAEVADRALYVGSARAALGAPSS